MADSEKNKTVYLEGSFFYFEMESKLDIFIIIAYTMNGK